jgi:hypothetical protein
MFPLRSASSLPSSYLAWSASARFVAAMVAAALLWVAVAWAIGWIG